MALIRMDLVGEDAQKFSGMHKESLLIQPDLCLPFQKIKNFQLAVNMGRKENIPVFIKEGILSYMLVKYHHHLLLAIRTVFLVRCRAQSLHDQTLCAISDSFVPKADNYSRLISAILTAE